MPDPRASAMLQNLKRAGFKLTPQRMAIVECFAGDESHPTAQDLFERLRGAFPTMSFATVYNTLAAIDAAGLSRTLHLGGAARFDPNMSAHHHAVCDRCGAVRDVPAPTLAPEPHLADEVMQAAGFRVHTIERVYRGHCGDCEVRAGNHAL